MVRILTAALLILPFLAAACERAEDTRQAEAVPPARTPEPVPAAPAPEPAATMDSLVADIAAAREQIAKQNLQQSAEHLRSAAGNFIIMGGQATGETRQALMTTAGELEGIAQDVKASAFRDTTMFDRAIAPVDESLARYHLRVARENALRHDLRSAGRDLKAAADHVESAGRRAGRALSTTAQQTVREARDLADKMARGLEQTPAEIERISRRLAREIDKIDGNESRRE